MSAGKIGNLPGCPSRKEIDAVVAAAMKTPVGTDPWSPSKIAEKHLLALVDSGLLRARSDTNTPTPANLAHRTTTLTSNRHPMAHLYEPTTDIPQHMSIRGQPRSMNGSLYTLGSQDRLPPRGSGIREERNVFRQPRSEDLCLLNLLVPLQPNRRETWGFRG